MFAFSRALLCAFVAFRLLTPGTAEAQSCRWSYARILTSDEVHEVMHCAWCSYEMDGSIYVVRTTEGPNIPFADENTALSAGSV